MAEVKVKKSKTKSSTEKWRSKKWYTVKAPAIFDSKEVGQIVSSDEENLKNRVIIVNLSSLVSSALPNLPFTNVKLRVINVVGSSGETKFIGHELLSSYVKSLIRRRRSLIQNVEDVNTSDNKKIRIKTICITQNKVSEQTKRDIRKAIATKLKEVALSLTLDEFCLEMLFGKLSTKVFNAAKIIAPIKRFEIKKSELFETF